MKLKTGPILFALVVALLLLNSTAFFVQETEHVIITEFGKYKRTISTPGLNFKTPFTQTIIRVERRILASDAARYVSGVVLPVDGGWSLSGATVAMAGAAAAAGRSSR